MSDGRSIFRSAVVVGFFTVLSRVAGLARDILVSRLLGTTHAGDAFNIAFRIPNLLRRLTAEGAASAAFIPIFTAEDKQRGRESAMLFAADCLCLIVSILTVLTVLGIFVAPALIKVYAWGFRATAGKTELAILLTRIMFPYMLLISLSALGMGILNSLKSFAAPAAGPILLNLAMIASATLIAPNMQQPAIALAASVVVGGILQLLLQVPWLIKAGFVFRWVFDLRLPAVRRMGRLLLPGLLGIGVTQINVIVGSAFASMAGKGAVTAYYLSDRLTEFLLGVYVVAIATAILPPLAHLVAAQQWEDYSSLFCQGLRMVVFLALPATLGLCLLRHPIISTLFEHGHFDADSTALTAIPLLYASAGLTALAALKIIVPAFYARHDTRTPVKVAVLALIVNLLANVLLLDPMGVAGPAMAAVLAAWINCLALYMVIRKQLFHGHETLLLTSFARSGAAAAAAGLLLHWANSQVSWSGLTDFSRIAALGAMVALAAAAHFTAAWALRCPEVREFSMFFRRRAIGTHRAR